MKCFRKCFQKCLRKLCLPQGVVGILRCGILGGTHAQQIRNRLVRLHVRTPTRQSICLPLRVVVSRAGPLWTLMCRGLSLGSWLGARPDLFAHKVLFHFRCQASGPDGANMPAQTPIQHNLCLGFLALSVQGDRLRLWLLEQPLEFCLFIVMGPTALGC